MDNIFGIRLKQLRKEKNISAETLANFLGINKSTISRYETGKTDPFLPIALKIANYFNVSIDWLAGTTDHREPFETSIDISNLYNSLNIEKKKEIINYIKYLKQQKNE